MHPKDSDKLLSSVVAQLGEHFDAVQVMVAWNEQGKSFTEKCGCGLWVARMGLAMEMIKEEEAQQLSVRLGDQLCGEGFLIEDADDDDFENENWV
jgi:hypothetical protein